MSPTEISTAVIALGGVLVTVITLLLNRKAQVEQRRDQQAAEAFRRMEKELDRAREDNKELRADNEALHKALYEQDDLRGLIERLTANKEK